MDLWGSIRLSLPLGCTIRRYHVAGSILAGKYYGGKNYGAGKIMAGTHNTCGEPYPRFICNIILKFPYKQSHDSHYLLRNISIITKDYHLRTYILCNCHGPLLYEDYEALSSEANRQHVNNSYKRLSVSIYYEQQHNDTKINIFWSKSDSLINVPVPLFDLYPLCLGKIVC